MVGDVEGGEHADLKLPLTRHDFGVDTANLDSGVQAGLVVGFYDIPGIDLASSHTAVIWTLWAGETALGPAVGSVQGIEKSIFLLKTEPGVVCFVLLH
jgi:hypothetical protein